VTQGAKRLFLNKNTLVKGWKSTWKREPRYGPGVLGLKPAGQVKKGVRRRGKNQKNRN
jgi:hypothetical protein